MGRKDRLEIVSVEEGNALSHWTELNSLTRTLFDLPIVFVARYLPLHFKDRVLSLMGMDISEGVSIAFEVDFDVFRPQLISIGENTTIGYDSTILTHEATQDEFRYGEVEIGKNVLIGAETLILPGVKIGDNATISAKSLVNRDVKEGEFVGGTPIETISENHHTDK